MDLYIHCHWPKGLFNYILHKELLSIIRPGRSRLLEFEKKDSIGSLIETFFNIQTRTFNRDNKQVIQKNSSIYIISIKTFGKNSDQARSFNRTELLIETLEYMVSVSVSENINFSLCYVLKMFLRR